LGVGGRNDTCRLFCGLGEDDLDGYGDREIPWYSTSFKVVLSSASKRVPAAAEQHFLIVVTLHCCKESGRKKSKMRPKRRLLNDGGTTIHSSNATQLCDDATIKTHHDQASINRKHAAERKLELEKLRAEVQYLRKTKTDLPNDNTQI
jgi:hypothetical protein